MSYPGNVTRFHGVWLGPVAAAAVLGGAAACTLVLGDIPEGRDPGASGGGGGSSGAAGAAGNPGGGGGSGGVSGAAGAAGAGCCDCDKDLVPSNKPGCNGNDCDDDDANVFPGQTKFFGTESKNNGFDYNCDQKLETEYKKLDCVALCDPKVDGYIGTAPQCGKSGDFGSCDGVLCQPQVKTQQVMRCR